MNRQGTLSKSDCLARYTAVRPTLDSFDVINTEHKDWFWRMVGHTAMVYKCPATGQLFVYESTSLNKFTGFSGVQLTPMRMWLRQYPGKVFVRRLICKRRPEETNRYLYFDGNLPVCDMQLARHIKKYRGVPYPDLSDPVQRDFLLNSAIDLPLGIGQNKNRDDIFFCTHLVAHAYDYCGLFDHPKEIITSEFQPDDTREGGTFEMILRKGLALDKEIQLK